MNFHQFLASLCEQFSLPQPPESTGRCDLQFDGVLVELAEDEEAQSVLISAHLGPVDAETGLDLLEDMLAENLSSNAGREGVLGIEADESVVVRHRLLYRLSTAQDAASVIRRVASKAARWQARIEAQAVSGEKFTRANAALAADEFV